MTKSVGMQGDHSTMCEFSVVANHHCALGENPLWHPGEHCLYWTDIERGTIFRYDPATQTQLRTYVGRKVGGFTFEESGLLLFLDRGAIALLCEGDLREIFAGTSDTQGTRFNDVIAAPQGRVFCGLMPDDQRSGQLLRLDPDGRLHTVLDGFGCPNGMAFSHDRTTFFFTDSTPRTIFSFDYDDRSGTLSNQRIFCKFPEYEGLPDGLTIDAEGHFWCAFWGGQQIVRISPNGEIVQRIIMPTEKITSLTFGGTNLDQLYVTSAGGAESDEDSALAGALFRLQPGISGNPEYFSRCSNLPIVKI
jgi:D-xylono/L-arabinono-1,4-lactonase